MLTNSVTQIYSGSKVIGRVKGDTFQKSIKGSKHMLHKPPAIAFDVSTLDQAERAGAVKVQVIDQETGITYRANLEHIKEKGFTFNRGFGEQIALTMEGWSQTRRGRLPVSQPALFKGM